MTYTFCAVIRDSRDHVQLVLRDLTIDEAFALVGAFTKNNIEFNISGIPEAKKEQ